MPYWKRAAILVVNLARYRELYSKSDIEIIVVDDGSPEPAIVGGKFPWPVRVIRLPMKQGALNPCVPLNVGVCAASGDKIVLTGPEITHCFPILEEMSKRVAKLGPRGYLAAACWSPNRKKWYCHSEERYKGPDRAGLHFCAMMTREFYEEIGGFCEEYRNGQAFEDVDFLWKLHQAKARCRISDDLITHHKKTARPEWPIGGLERNRKIFESRWGKQDFGHC